MLISQKTEYAMRVLAYLAGAEDGPFISTSMLSRALKIPRVFLAKIVQKMAAKGIVQSQKGKSGGIRIVDPRIQLFDIIEIFEPSFHFIKCLNKKYACFLKRKCRIRKVLIELESDFKNKLKGITLEGVAT